MNQDTISSKVLRSTSTSQERSVTTSHFVQVGVDYYKQACFIRYWATQHLQSKLPCLESLACSATMMAVMSNQDSSPDARSQPLRNAACVVVLTESGAPVYLCAKYRPPALILCVSTDRQTVRQVCCAF